MLAKVGQVSERIVQEDSQWGAVYLHYSPVSWLHSVLLNRKARKEWRWDLYERRGWKEASENALAIEKRKIDR